VETGGAQRWDYVTHPVLVNGEQPSKTTWSVHGYSGACAFDGYGAQGAKPAAVRGWSQKSTRLPHHLPSAELIMGRR
jgi:hypothetical protein